MKIGQANHSNQKKGIQPKLRKLIDGQWRWFSVFALLMIGLLAGFVYSWRIVPEIKPEVTVTVEVTQTATISIPTPIAVAIKEVVPLPELVIKVEIPTLANATPGLQPATSADVRINGAAAISAQMAALLTADQSMPTWQLTFPQTIKEFPLSGKQFSLIAAKQDDAVSLWLYLEQLKEAGIQVPEFSLCLISWNDEPMQVYYLVQREPDPLTSAGFSFQLPEEYFTASVMDAQIQAHILNLIEGSIYQIQPNPDADEMQKGLELLAFLMKQPDQFSAALDQPKFASYFVIHDLWAVPYADAWQDMYYFYNSKSGKIEPAIVSMNQVTLSGEGGEKSFPFSGNPLFSYPDLQINYLQTLTTLASEEKYLALQQTYYAEFHAYEKQIRLANETPYSSILELLNFRHQMMRIQVNPPYPLRGFVYANSGAECINISLLNLMKFPVDVTSIGLMGEEIPIEADWILEPGDPTLLQASVDGLRLRPFQNPDVLLNLCVPTRLITEILQKTEQEAPLEEVLRDETIWTVTARMSGLTKSYSVGLIPDSPALASTGRDIPPIQSIGELTAAFPFIKVNPAGDTLTFTAGEWQVRQDMVLPADLKVNFEAGCRLYFSPDAVLLSYSALQAHGTEAQPVIFSASAETWPGLVVINAAEHSQLEHVFIEHTGGIERGGWILTGGVTFYRSPVTVQNSTIHQGLVEDAINVIRTTFLFDQLTIQDTPSDAFDADFSDGDIVQCHFENIGGDAIDVSGSAVTVTDTSMLNITDKGLSAGEDSHITAAQLSIINVGIGAAAKDLSTLDLRDSLIQNAKVAGLAAYIKKSVYGPSTITAADVKIVDTATETLVQTSSRIELNGFVQYTQELNVKTLYALGILGN